MTTALPQLAINTIRTLSIDAVQQANSGHPGLPLGAAPMAYALWQYQLQHNPKDPHWLNRDRFVLSAGHGSMLIYSLLHLTGYDLPLDEIKAFRQWGSKTPGHPEYGHTAGVETTTGPLGQGIATAVGMALAERYLASRYNTADHTVIDHYTYVIAGDGDLMEGVSIEATALAGHWGLNRLIVLYDSNDITLDGEASMTFTEDIAARFAAQGWNVLHVADGNDYSAVLPALEQAKQESARPTIIIIKTTIGFGSPHKAGTSEAHGSPLGADEVKLTKQALGWPTEEAFYIPGEALEHFREALEKGATAQAAWNSTYSAWQAANPALAAELESAVRGELPAGWDADLPAFDSAVATRDASGQVLNAIAKHIPNMIGGDADLAGSTKTLIKGAGNTGHLHPAERNVRFGVREHGMGAIVNGLALHGGIIKPYSATFLTFSDYMRPAIRLGALMGIPTLYIFTHDSIGLGEDGPTHQPIEQVMSLRLIPGLTVFRPSDGNETVAAWHTAMTLKTPAVLIFTRQKLAALSGDKAAEGVRRGAYVLADSANPQVILLATGSEVEIAHQAYQTLTAEGIGARVVSMPSWELFEQQDAAYKASVLPAAITARVSIEAGVTIGWARYTGSRGITIGIDHFGASAPYQTLYKAFGLTAEKMVEAAKSLL